MRITSPHRFSPLSSRHPDPSRRSGLLLLMMTLLIFAGLWAASAQEYSCKRRSHLLRSKSPPSCRRSGACCPPARMRRCVAMPRGSIRPTTRSRTHRSPSTCGRTAPRGSSIHPWVSWISAAATLPTHFCTDIYHSRAYNRSFCLDSGFFSDWRVAWIVTPLSADPQQRGAAGRPPGCGVALHRWLGARPGRRHPLQLHVRCGRAERLQRDPGRCARRAAGRVSTRQHPARRSTPTSSTGFLPYQPTHTFTVRLTKGAYPLAGYTVNVATSLGTLDQDQRRHRQQRRGDVHAHQRRAGRRDHHRLGDRGPAGGLPLH